MAQGRKHSRVRPPPDDGAHFATVIVHGTILRVFCFHGHARILSQRVRRPKQSGSEAGFWLGIYRAALNRGRLALSDTKKSGRTAKQPSGAGGDGQTADRDVGHALRSVYAKTVSEDIPSELLDLLGKLS
jgi:hypothetical protein